MNFINPLELIDPTADLQRERRRLLTDAELTGTWSNGSVTLEKSELITLLDALQQPETVAHYRLLLRYPQLNAFLTSGDVALFDAPLPGDTALTDLKFLAFITPFFLEKYHALIRSCILQPGHIGRMEAAVAAHPGSVVSAIAAFDESMQPEKLQRYLTWRFPVLSGRERTEAIQQYCSQLNQHLNQLAEQLRRNRIMYLASYESFYVTHPEIYMVRFAQRNKMLLGADERLLLGVSVISMLLRWKRCDSATNDRMLEAVNHFAGFLDGMETELTRPGERDTAGERYFSKMILRKEKCLSVKLDLPFNRVNPQLAYFFAWLITEGPSVHEFLRPGAEAAIKKFKAKELLPGELFEQCCFSLLNTQDVQPDMRTFVKNFLGYQMSIYFDRIFKTDILKNFDHPETFESYEQYRDFLRKRYEEERTTPPLVTAAYEGKTEKVQELIAAGADVNQPDYRKCTAVYMAALGGHTEIVRMLLAAGANVNVIDQFGNMPLSSAASFGHIEIVNLLLAAGADVNLKNEAGETALYKATEAREKNVRIAKLLLDAGAAINDCGPEPIITNCWRHSCLGVVPLLVKHGADINGKNKKGQTLLHIEAGFCREDHWEKLRDIQMLLDNGADKTIPDADGKLAWEIAAGFGNPKAVGMLKD